MLRSNSPKLGDWEGDELLDPCLVAHAPSAVHATPRNRRLDSLGGNNDITFSPGELGGSQYVMSPGEHMANTLARTQSTMSDGQSAIPSTVEEVAAEELRATQQLFPIFIRGRKLVHLVRHGQSTYNEAISGPGSWDEPNIFDAPLTNLGKRQAKSLGTFLAKLPKETVWVTSALTRAMETCIHGYRASLEVKSAQKRRGAGTKDCASDGGDAWSRPALSRGKSRLSHGGRFGCSSGGTGNEAAERETGNDGSAEGTPMVEHGSRSTRRSAGRHSDQRKEAGGSDEGRGVIGQQEHLFEETDDGGLRRLCVNGVENGELSELAIGASPNEGLELDGAEMAEWGERVIVHPHLSEKLSTSGDIGRHKGVLMNEFPLLALGISRLPGDVWWYNQPNRPNDAEREMFGAHEPTAKFKDRVNKFRHWLMSREDKVFVIFGHSTFFKELVGGNRSLKNCEVHTYHL